MFVYKEELLHLQLCHILSDKIHFFYMLLKFYIFFSKSDEFTYVCLGRSRHREDKPFIRSTKKNFNYKLHYLALYNN